MITEAEIVESLEPLNGGYFSIPDLGAYASKVKAHGKALTMRANDELLAYVLYYDNQPTAFVTMVWTKPDAQGQGIATALMRSLQTVCGKPIALQVHEGNPARRIYERLGYLAKGVDGHLLNMSLTTPTG